MSPHLSHVAMAHKNYFRRNNLWILKLATYIQRLKITILGANWQLFRLERIAKCSYFIVYTQNIKFYWFVQKIKKFMLPIWWYNRGWFPLGNKYLGSSFWMGFKVGKWSDFPAQIALKPVPCLLLCNQRIHTSFLHLHPLPPPTGVGLGNAPVTFLILHSMDGARFRPRD